MKKIKKALITGSIAGAMIMIILIAAIAAYAEQYVLIFQKKNQVERVTNIALSGLPPFITSEMIIGALETQQSYGYPASVCIAQIIQESGFGLYGPGGDTGEGLSYLAYNYKNLFGIKGKNGTAGGVQITTREEASDGTIYTTIAWFRAYNSYTDCINDRARILTNVYSDLISGVTDADAFAQAIGQRWATDSSYAESLISHMQRYNLYRLDTMSVSDYINGSGAGSDISGMPYYYQNDYAHISYGTSNLAKSGCGPTSFAMIASYLSGDQITPDEAVAWCGNAYYIAGAGTTWSYFSAAARHFNLGCNVLQMSPSASTSEAVLNALRQGHPVISSQRPGLFTSGGHYIVLSAIDENGKISVHDPNKNNAINKGYNDRKFDFSSEINVTSKQYWIFQ